MSLSRTVTWSKPMIDGYFGDIKNNVFLISDEAEERQEQADRILALVPERLWPYFWKTVFYELSISLESGHKKYLKMLKKLAVSFVNHPELNINELQYKLSNQIRDYCAVCWNIFNNRKAWRCTG